MKRILVVFITRAILLLGISTLAVAYVPYKGFFPYRDTLPLYNLPPFLYSLANFDGLHYLAIAKEGYHQYEQAFFPLYPLLIRFLAFLFGGNHLVTGLIISNMSLIIGLYFMYKLVSSFGKEFSRSWFLAFLIFFPTAFFLSAVYTEGLFFMLATATLYFLKTKRFVAAAVCAALASATRLIGIGLFFPFLLTLPFKKRGFMSYLLLFSPFLGLFLYMMYLWRSTGDPLFFFHAQPAFGASRSTNLILLPQVYFRYFKIFVTARFNFSYFIALIEFLFFTFAFFICILEFLKTMKSRSRFFFAVSCFSLFNLVIPTLTGTFSSLPRYALMSLSLFFYLSRLKNRVIKTMIAVFFCGLQVALLSFFIQGYFVS